MRFSGECISIILRESLRNFKGFNYHFGWFVIKQEKIESYSIQINEFIWAVLRAESHKNDI